MRRRSTILAWFALQAVGYSLLILAGSAFAQQSQTDDPRAEAEKPSKLYSFRRIHDPNGIGKFYMGREIARVMGFHGAAWLNRPQREKQEDLSKLIELLEIKPGSTAADIGSGTGVVTERLARAVGPKGTVYAVDIQDEMLRMLGERMKKRGIKNVVPVLGEIEDPKLEDNSVDLILMVDVYHEFSHPHEMIEAMVPALRPGGRIVLVEYRKEDPRVPIKVIHKMTEKQVKRELLRPEFGLEWVATHEELPRQHVIVFRKPEGEEGG